ncbi:MAG: hypothetical protein KGY99_08725 [Phycisphaerae bacterium]|nr:hypothetical protein [Phycisphaerae bacterium]
MTRNAALKVLNPILGLLLVNQLVTGMSHESLSHETYEWLHVGGGIVLALAAVGHLALNWKWVSRAYRRREA